MQWAVRICHDPDDWSYELRANKLFRHLKRKYPETKAPNVYFQAECPVLFSEWVDGNPLAIWSSQTLPTVKRQRFLDDLAEFLQLWTTPAPPPAWTPAP